MRKLGWWQQATDWFKPSPEPGVTASVSTVSGDILHVATRLVRKAAETPHSGSFKRWLVMRQLLQKFPDARRRDLALAIELAVRAVDPGQEGS